MQSFHYIALFTSLFLVTAAFDVRKPLIPRKLQTPVFHQTSAHSGAMPLARVLAHDVPKVASIPRLTKFDEEQKHEKTLLDQHKDRPQQFEDKEAVVPQHDVKTGKEDSVKKLSVPKPASWPDHLSGLPPRSKSPHSPIIDNARYLGVGRRDVDEEVFPSDFLKERAAKQKRKEEYERIQQLNPAGRWYFFVPSSPVFFDDQ